MLSFPLFSFEISDELASGHWPHDLLTVLDPSCSGFMTRLDSGSPKETQPLNFRCRWSEEPFFSTHTSRSGEVSNKKRQGVTVILPICRISNEVGGD